MANIVKQIKKHLGIDEETLSTIVNDGFYYYREKDNEIYWENSARFIGRGRNPKRYFMIGCYSLPNDDPCMFCPAPDRVFCFTDYGKTWSICKNDLQHLIKEKKKMSYLKIKDDVDLKELEKFGFENWLNKGYELHCGGHRTLGVRCSDRRIILTVEIIDEPEYYGIGLDNLYDLIQAGLVEKVDEETI